MGGVLKSNIKLILIEQVYIIFYRIAIILDKNRRKKIQSFSFKKEKSKGKQEFKGMPHYLYN